MNLSRIVRWAGTLLGAATIALAAGAQSSQPQQPQTPTGQPSTNQQNTNQQNTATPAQQQAAPEPPQETETLQLFSREVDLFFAVTDKHGNFVNGLQQQNFGLLDDGRPPERIIRFVQQTNLPLRVGIMIDTSSSIRLRFTYEQQAAVDFLLQVMHPVDRAFVEGFDVQIDIEQDYTNRVDLLDGGISRLRPGGGTALYDSLYKTCRDQMLSLQQTADDARPLFIGELPCPPTGFCRAIDVGILRS